MNNGGAASVLDLLTFSLDGERCALLASAVREVVRAALPTRLPKAPPIVSGVLNVRGELVPVLDIRQRFGLSRRTIDPDDYIVVARAGGRVVAFAVERALDLVQVPATEIHAATEIAAGTKHVAGIVRLSDGLLVIYDLHGFLSVNEALVLDRSLAGTQTS